MLHMPEHTRRPRGPAQHHLPPRDVPQDIPQDIAREEFARRLQQAMALKGWSQSDLAREASKQLPGAKKVGKDSVSQYVRAVTFPNPEKLQALAKALGTTPYDLMPTRGLKTTSVTEGHLPELDVHQTSRGSAWVRINQELSWDAAVKILALIKDDKDGRDA